MSESLPPTLWLLTQTMRGVPQATKIAFEAYLNKADAMERAAGLEKAQGDRYDTDVIEVPLNKFRRISFRVEFSPSRLEWQAIPMEYTENLEATVKPIISPESGSWIWRPVYAMTRMDAIRTCQDYATKIVRTG